MICPRPEQLQRLLTDQIDEAEREAIEAHVETCTACQETLAHLAGTGQAMPQQRPRHEPGTGFLDRLKQMAVPTPGARLDTRPRPEATRVRDGVDGPDELAAVPGYEILGVLGRGGMGIVYKARQQTLGRLVALKMILAGEHAGAEQRQRFRKEAEALARLQHPNIIQIHEVGEADGRPYFALEFVEGGSLAQKLQGTPLPARQAAELLEVLY